MGRGGGRAALKILDLFFFAVNFVVRLSWVSHLLLRLNSFHFDDVSSVMFSSREEIKQ